MSRQPTRTTDARPSALQLRVSKAEYAAFKSLAKRRHKTLSELIRQLLYAELGGDWAAQIIKGS